MEKIKYIRCLLVGLHMTYGTLYLIPVPLADEAASASFTPYLSHIIQEIGEYIVENEKTARKFLKQAGLKIPQSELTIHDYSKHARKNTNASTYLSGLLQGRDVGLMSEAGCPGVADPGADVVAQAHEKGIKVVPLVGPSAILLALMASGFNGQSFAFQGYLPIDKTARRLRIKALEQLALQENQTQLFIETPFRNNQLLEEVLQNTRPNTRLCIACNLTGIDELVISQPVSAWKKGKYDFHKKPAIFLIFK